MKYSLEKLKYNRFGVLNINLHLCLKKKGVETEKDE
jgi:hypothetical protein